MKTHIHLLKYLKFNKVLKCAKELDELVNEKNPIERNKLITKVKDCVIDAISEIAKNCLEGNIPLSEENFNNLKKYQSILRLISKNIPVKKRRNLIVQKGGFIDLLIPAALCLITVLIKELIN